MGTVVAVVDGASSLFNAVFFRLCFVWPKTLNLAIFSTMSHFKRCFPSHKRPRPGGLYHCNHHRDLGVETGLSFQTPMRPGPLCTRCSEFDCLRTEEEWHPHFNCGKTNAEYYQRAVWTSWAAAGC